MSHFDVRLYIWSQEIKEHNEMIEKKYYSKNICPYCKESYDMMREKET